MTAPAVRILLLVFFGEDRRDWLRDAGPPRQHRRQYMRMVAEWWTFPCKAHVISDYAQYTVLALDALLILTISPYQQGGWTPKSSGCSPMCRRSWSYLSPCW